ncbi:hypothetical protein [Aureimonas sp. Leaf454]|uniref:hypothetical protein n=1 Tax=Aureimonas sp. Leaf454 TaxID=1736381 RepID=UPI0012E3F6CD|nr:hypothetical protein [Aureimonas sp. Leaf454]
MIARLTILTSLLALFALSFAGLIETTRPSHASFSATAPACLDRGLVCPSN